MNSFEAGEGTVSKMGLSSQYKITQYEGGRLATWYWAWHAQIALSSVAPVVITLKGTTQRMSCKRPSHIAAEKSLFPPKRAKHSCVQWMRAGAKGWVQEEEHSTAEIQAVVKVKVGPPKGNHRPEKSIDRDLIPKVPCSICRCPAQRRSADRNDMACPYELARDKRDKRRMGHAASERKEKSSITHPSHSSQRRIC